MKICKNCINPDHTEYTGSQDDDNGGRDTFSDATGSSDAAIHKTAEGIAEAHDPDSLHTCIDNSRFCSKQRQELPAKDQKQPTQDRAGNKKRMLKTYGISLTYAFIAGAILGGLLLVFGPQFLSLFATEPAVIDAGMERIRIMGFSYAFSCFMDCSIAASRGIGKSIPPTIIIILGSCVFRVIWFYTVFAHFQTISSLYLLYIFSWGITGFAEVLFFAVSFRKIRV